MTVTKAHEHQELALTNLRKSVSGGKRRPMLQAPTGWGKTLLGAMVVEAALAKKNRVAFCVPRIELIDQTVAAFYEEGVTDVGVIQANHHMTHPGRSVQVCSAQTLSRRTPPDVSFVVVDEAHERHKIIEDWMKDDPRKIFVGLSATPWTKGLGQIYDDLIVAGTTKELIAKGFLSKFRVFSPSEADLNGVKKQMGDYSLRQLGEVAKQKALVADVVESWLERGENRPTLCYAVDRAHAAELRDRFNDAGVGTAYMDALTPKRERDDIRMRFHAGLVRVVCNVGVLTTGIDWDVRCIILARPTSSEILFTQIIGRGLRTAPGKDHCLILDHTGSHLRLGFVDDIHHEHLDTGRLGKFAEREKPKPRVCSHCMAVKKEWKCENCGYEPPGKPCTVFEGDGTLNLTNEIREKRRLKSIQSYGTFAAKHQFYAELLGHAINKEYKAGWAYHKFKEKFGYHPIAHEPCEPADPSPRTLSWIRSRQIAWAKSKKRNSKADMRAEGDRLSAGVPVTTLPPQERPDPWNA